MSRNAVVSPACEVVKRCSKRSGGRRSKILYAQADEVIEDVNQHSGLLEQRHAGFLRKSNGQEHGLPVLVE